MKTFKNFRHFQESRQIFPFKNHGKFSLDISRYHVVKYFFFTINSFIKIS